MLGTSSELIATAGLVVAGSPYRPCELSQIPGTSYKLLAATHQLIPCIVHSSVD